MNESSERKPTKRPKLEIEMSDLLAYLDGDAASEVALAIEADPALLDEVAILRRTESFFSAALLRSGCPDTDNLLMYQAELLSDDDANEIASHLLTCPHCQIELADLEAGIQLPEVEATPSPSVGWLEALRQAGRRVIELEKPAVPRAPAYALRGASRQLMLQSDGFQVVLMVHGKSAEMQQIEGQVVRLADPLSVPSGAVHLRDDDTILQTTSLNEFGHFAIDNVHSNDYTLQIDVDPTTSLTLTLDTD